MVRSIVPSSDFWAFVCLVGVLGIRAEKPPSLEVNSFHAGPSALRTLPLRNREVRSPANRSLFFIGISFAGVQQSGVNRTCLDHGFSSLARRMVSGCPLG